jgi:hypothetical protein
VADEHTLVLKHFDPVDRRLGRHVAHDSRSLRFRAPAKDPRKLASVRHVVNVPIMDQGMEGSCTGHAGTANLGHPHFWAAGRIAIGLNDPHDYAVGLYSAATEIDPWQGTFRPDDTGSDGLSIAKVLHARGLISGYQHATSLAATLTALEQRVVMVGTSWLEGMYDTAPDGQMTVSGMELGGHEYALDELDVERQRVWIRNSWGEGYGLRGRAWMTWDDLAKLLAMQGDCTVLIPLAEPPPQPTPEPPPKPARPIEDVQLAQALTKFLGTTSVPKYVRTAATAWLKSKE